MSSAGTERSVVIVGDLAAKHVGDEAMLQANLDGLRRCAPGLHIQVVAPDPTGLRERLGVDSVLTPPDAEGVCGQDLLAALERASGLFISGGGNLRSTWPLLLQERVALMRAAQALGKPVVVTGQTLGPELSSAEQLALAGTLGKAAFVGVRELPSAALAAGLGVPAERLWCQADDALLLEAAPPRDAGLPPWLDEPWLGLTLDPSFADPGAAATLHRLAEDLAGMVGRHGLRLLFISHVGAPGQAEADDRAGSALQALLAQRKVACHLYATAEPRAVAWVTRRAAAVISSRYHPLVFACAGAVPGLGIFRDRYTRIKLQGALAHAGLSAWTLSANDVEGGLLARRFGELWQRQKDIRQSLVNHRPALEEEAQARWSVLAGALGLAAPPGPDALRFGRPSTGVLLAALEREREAAREPGAGSWPQEREALLERCRRAEEYASSLRDESERLRDHGRKAEEYALSLRDENERLRTQRLSAEEYALSLRDENERLRNAREESSRDVH